MSIQTLSDLVFHLRDLSAGRPDLLTVRWPAKRESVSTTEFLRSIHSLVLALEERGLEHGDRVAIYSETRPEWHTVDFACQLLGLVSVPLNPELESKQLGFILRNSGSHWVFYSNLAKREMLVKLQSGLTAPIQMVAFETEAAVPGGLTLTTLLGEGAARCGDIPLERYRGRCDENDLGTLLYTAGTTGDPKGVMLSQGNLVANFKACGEVFSLGPEDLALAFLPLSHGFQRTIDHLCFFRGVPIHYVPSLEQVGEALREMKPSLLAALPRVYERAYQRTLQTVQQESPFRQSLFRWALGAGRRYLLAARGGLIGPILALERRLAKRLVYRGIRQRFGGRLRFAISGGGSISTEVGEFFRIVGVPLYQAYGLAETSPLLASNAPRQQRQGSVGKALTDVELKVAEDGEILAKGPGLMQGYWDNPQASAASVDESGWLHTGDVGHIDQSGYLFVTDRKKDLLTLADGRRVAPQPIEKLLTSRGLFTHAVVVGNDAPFLGALLVPDFELLKHEFGDLPNEDLAAHPEVRQRAEALVAEANLRLLEADQIRHFHLLEREFSAERGELTSSQKVRRKVVVQRCAEQIARLFA
jgi:long-chain acyl-CoA synthetase